MTFSEIDNIALKSKTPLSQDLERINNVNGEGLQPYFRFLYHLAIELGGNCLEIGVYRGAGSFHMAASGNKTLGIDHQKQHDIDTFDFIEGDSVDEGTIKKVKSWVKKNGKIKLLFQDSSHHYWPSVKEWELYSPFMAEGGIWVCDDITPAFYNPNPNPNGRPEYQDPIGKGMVQYFESRPGDKKKYQNLHIGNAVGVILMDTISTSFTNYGKIDILSRCKSCG